MNETTHSISREKAIELVRGVIKDMQEIFGAFRASGRFELDLYLCRTVVAPGTFKLGVGSIDAAEAAGEHGSWVFFLDPLPSANYAHPCWYFFVDRDGSVRTHPAMWYPDGWYEQYDLVKND